MYFSLIWGTHLWPLLFYFKIDAPTFCLTENSFMRVYPPSSWILEKPSLFSSNFKLHCNNLLKWIWIACWKEKHVPLLLSQPLPTKQREKLFWQSRQLWANNEEVNFVLIAANIQHGEKLSLKDVDDFSLTAPISRSGKQLSHFAFCLPTNKQ